MQNNVEHYLDFFFEEWKGRIILKQNILLIFYWRFQFDKIKTPIGTINWDIETYRNKLEKFFFRIVTEQKQWQLLICDFFIVSERKLSLFDQEKIFKEHVNGPSNKTLISCQK